jgi:predicted metal-dependent phosphoesterase TrpH
VLPPAALIERAAGRGVSLLALTDHDETRGLPEAGAAALRHGLHFVAGVEISVTWADQGLHVLGLDIDPAHPVLMSGLDESRCARSERAARIAAELEATGIEGSLAGALRHAANPSAIGRSHFARYLVEIGAARDNNDVFRRYLASGKPGFVPPRWPSLDRAVGWIRSAGGHAVLAHPERYALSGARLRALLREFRDCGGAGLEIGATLRDNPGPHLALAQSVGLAVSVGSDFHAPGAANADIGDTPALPPGVACIWDRFAGLRAAA